MVSRWLQSDSACNGFGRPSGFWYPLNIVQDTTAQRIVTAGYAGVSLYGPNAGQPHQQITNFYAGTAIAALVNATIYARSTVSGAFAKGGPKAVPVSPISATSTISGSTGAIRKVTPAALSATSTVSG